MLAGYAVVTSSGWGIIAQRPTAVTLEPIQELIWARSAMPRPWRSLSCWRSGGALA